MVMQPPVTILLTFPSYVSDIQPDSRRHPSGTKGLPLAVDPADKSAAAQCPFLGFGFLAIVATFAAIIYLISK